jgi:hypothetical protein
MFRKVGAVMPKASRLDVYVTINDERNYQDVRWQNSPNEGHATTAEYITYLQHYIGVAQEQITRGEDDSMALDTMRKIAALGVACMEDNGIQHRKRSM